MPKKIVKLKAKIKAKKPAAVSKPGEYNKCLRCDRKFPSRDALKRHLKIHMQALREIKMLEEGFVPSESKIGQEFRGKNKIIIS